MSYAVVSNGNGGEASLLFPPASFSKVDSMNSVIFSTTIEEALLAKVARFPNALILSTSSKGGSLLLPLSLSPSMRVMMIVACSKWLFLGELNEETVLECPLKVVLPNGSPLELIKCVERTLRRANGGSIKGGLCRGVGGGGFKGC